MMPWENEPDFKEFYYEDIHCKIIRNPQMKFLCAYAGVTKEHSLYGKDMTTSHLLDCHCGITFSGTFPNSDYWYFGFDCAHLNDLIPGMFDLQIPIGIKRQGVYRDFDYVESQVINLAKQLHENKLRYLFISTE